MNSSVAKIAKKISGLIFQGFQPKMRTHSQVTYFSHTRLLIVLLKVRRVFQCVVKRGKFLFIGVSLVLYLKKMKYYAFFNVYLDFIESIYGFLKLFLEFYVFLSSWLFSQVQVLQHWFKVPFKGGIFLGLEFYLGTFQFFSIYSILIL